MPSIFIKANSAIRHADTRIFLSFSLRFQIQIVWTTFLAASLCNSYIPYYFFSSLTAFYAPLFHTFRYAVKMWPFGDFLCRLVEYIQTTTALVSIWTLTFMSLERYLAITRPITSITMLTARYEFFIAFVNSRDKLIVLIVMLRAKKRYQKFLQKVWKGFC